MHDQELTDMVILFGLALGLLCVYLLPTWVACVLRSRGGWLLFLANVVTGWTGIGWLLCLLVAVLARPRRYVPRFY